MSDFLWQERAGARRNKPVVTNAAMAAPPTHGGTWSFADYTADPGSLAANDAFHTATGASITSYCEGSRVPSVPQDLTVHALKVAGASTLKLHLAATGAWGVDVSTRPGAYVVRACNLGGAPTARVDYSLTH
jgi:hypothetical protein